ncbi:MAG: hypothetical protein CMO44_17485 [Verrucomicrobiales bacterium]|nr:hypothetical protein [Verrucomicrobiales bacterium]
MSVNYDDQGKAVSVSFDNIPFEIIPNAGGGDCFLLAILEYLYRNRIDPLLGTGNGNRRVNAAQYREFLFQRLLNLLNNGYYNNKDGFIELNYDGNITKINDFLWKKLRTKLRKDMAAKQVNICNPNEYIGELMFELIVVLYKKIKNIYVYHISEKAGRKKAFKVWTRYFIDKEPRKNYAVVKAKKMKNDFKPTKESSMFILFRSNPGAVGINHFELMSPLLDDFTVNVPRETSSGSDTLDLTDGDDNESSRTTNDAILTDIIRQAKDTRMQLIKLREGENTCLRRAGYVPRKQKDGSTRYEQEDAMEAFNRLAELGELYENPNNPGTYLEKGSDILKSFYARQFKITKCTDPNIVVQREKTPRDERLTVSFQGEIKPLSNYVKQQIETLKTPNQWKYDDENNLNCDAIQTLSYKFYDYVLIQLKIFIKGKRKFTEDEQQTLIDNGRLNLPTVDDDDDQEFQLIGSINHQGETQNSGHYVACVKKQTGWYLCNDSTISRPYTDYPYFKEYQPYILFYKRIRIALDNTKPKGIENKGNSCYVNALLQNIINVPELFIRNPRRSATSSGSRSATSSASISGSNSRFSMGRRGKGLRGKGRSNTSDRRLSDQINTYQQQQAAKFNRRNQAAELKARRDELEGWKKYLLENPGLDENERKRVIKRIRELEGKGNSNEKGDSNKMDVDDSNTESDNDTAILGFVNDDDNNNNNNNYGDDERKGDEPPPKKIKLDSDLDKECQDLLNKAIKRWRDGEGKNIFKDLEEYLDFVMQTVMCSPQVKRRIAEIRKEKSQKRSLISLSRMTL